MNTLKALFFATLGAGALFAGQANAIPANLPPPSGAILNLDGQPLPQSYFARYSVDFTATDTVTDIIFAGRDDPGYTYLDNISVSNTHAPDTNLIQNGNFENGRTTNGGNDFAPVGWSYQNPHGLTFPSVVDCYSVDASTVNCSWINQGVGAYDSISQSIDTAIGDTYQIAFYAAWIPGYSYSQETHWSELSTNGFSGTHGNGVNIAVYANAASPIASVPEPAALGMFGIGVLLIGVFARLRRRLALRLHRIQSEVPERRMPRALLQPKVSLGH